MGKPYFASLSGSELAREVYRRVDNFYLHLFRDTYYRRALESYRTFHGLPTPDNAWDNIDILTQLDGSGGTTHRIKTGTYSAIGQSLITMTTANRPDIKPIEATTDTSSSKATLLAADLIEYYFKKKGIEARADEAVATAVVQQDGYVLMVWNETAGPQATVDGVPYVDPDTGEPGFTGDLEVSSLTPFDMAIDLTWRGSGERPWVVTRSFVDKAGLMAQWPAFAEQIEREVVGTRPEHKWPATLGILGQDQQTNEQVAVFTLWHRKTRAVPEGLMAMVINDRTCLFQGPLPFGDNLPVYRVSAGIQQGTTKGRSPLILQLALQRGLDIGMSVALTNMAVWGPGSMSSPKGTGIDPSDLGGGAKLFEFDAPEGNPQGKPEPMAMPMTAPAIFQTMQTMTQTMEANSGANASVRGQAPVEFSGAAQALQVEQARQFNSDLQASFVSLYERMATGLLKILKLYAKAPQTAVIVGKNKAPFLQQWKNEDLQGVDTVYCSIGSSVANTTAGRLQIASDLLSKKLITPEQYLEILRTGNLDTETDPTELQNILIREENEALSEGRDPPVCFTDNDQQHLLWHMSGLNTPEARNNPQILQAYFNHINRHRWKMALPPGQLCPPQVPMGSVPPPPPPPAAPPPPGPLPPNTTGIVVAPPPPGASPDQVNGGMPQRLPRLPSMPNLPKSPLSGRPVGGSI